MKRGIVLNLIVILILIFFILLPVFIFIGTENLARSKGCLVEGADWGEGVCQDLYSLAFVGGLVGSVTSPLLIGVLGLYLLGVAAFFIFSLLRSRSAGRPVSPVARGMFSSSLVLGGIAACISGGLLVANWYRSSFISACRSLPSPTAMNSVPNGPLAIGVKLPYPEGRPEQYVIQVTSSDGEVLNTLKELPASKTPAWAPDGLQLVFAAQAKSSGLWGLYLADPQGRVSGPVLENSLEMQVTGWAPDGRGLLFQRWQEQAPTPDTQVYAVNLDGSGLRPLTAGQDFDGEARYSPDGKEIVFVSKRNGGGDIYRMNVDGSGLQRLTYNNQDDINPEWSPDGNWIVFASNRSRTGVYNLFIMAPDGTNQCQLTQGEKTEWKPAWSPDGSWIAFIAWGENQVYRVRPDGSELTRIGLPEELTPLSLDWSRKP